VTPAAILTNQIRLAVSDIGARLFVVTVGKFWSGQVVGKTPSGNLILKNARIVNVGFEGQSDLCGFTPTLITQDMVGQVIPVFSVVEVKAGKDRIRPAQQKYIDAIKKIGGRAGVARSPEDAIRILKDQAGE